MIIVIIIPLIFILGIIYYNYNPENNALFPKCPFKYATGLDCPGCGSQRGIHALLHFNILQAFKYNALMVVSIPYMLIGAAFNFDMVKKRFPNTRNFLFGQKAIFVVLIIVILFTIIRNF